MLLTVSYTLVAITSQEQLFIHSAAIDKLLKWSKYNTRTNMPTQAKLQKQCKASWTVLQKYGKHKYILHITWQLDKECNGM